MSLCAENLCLSYFQGLGNTLLVQWHLLKQEVAFHNRQLCGLSTISLALSFNLYRYYVPLLYIMCRMLWCNVSETAPILTHNCGETYFIGEELHEIVQNSNNEKYIENKHSGGNNVGTDKEADETEESAIQGEDDGRRNKKLPVLDGRINKKLPVLHIQSADASCTIKQTFFI